jgi:hypothetical protein
MELVKSITQTSNTIEFLTDGEKLIIEGYGRWDFSYADLTTHPLFASNTRNRHLTYGVYIQSGKGVRVKKINVIV